MVVRVGLSDRDAVRVRIGDPADVQFDAIAGQRFGGRGTATAEEAVRAARDGDARARAGLAEVGRYLGIGIANMITVISPDRVVLGGGVAAAGEFLFAPIRAEIAQRVRTTSIDDVTLVAAELGTLAGAIGAAVHGAEAVERRGAATGGTSEVTR